MFNIDFVSMMGILVRTLAVTLASSAPLGGRHAHSASFARGGHPAAHAMGRDR
jgi:hypothetical protein